MIRSISRVGIVVLGLAAAAFAQESRGTIQGTVKDPQGAVLVGASVVVKETGTQTTVSLKSNEVGRYAAPLLMPGSYVITVEAPGFKKAVRDGIALLTGDVRTVDVMLEIGAPNEQVTVTGEAPLIDVTSTSTGAALDDRTVRDLPVMTGVVTSMFQYLPGVNAGGGAELIIGPHSTGNGSDYNNGSGVGGNVWTIDGAFSNGTGRSTSNLPPVNSVAEVKVLVNSFDGSFGHSLGLGIAVTTKSGNNMFHGDASENYWSQRWWASNLFTKQAYYSKINAALAKGDQATADSLASQPIQPAGHSNLYGFTATGPVRIPKLLDLRNRAFWTLNFTGQRDKKTEDPSVYARVVPSAAEKTGDFSDLYNVKSDGKNYQLFDPFSVRVDPNRTGVHYVRDPLPGNILPGTYSAMGKPFYKNYTKYWPDPNNWYDQTKAQDSGGINSDFQATATPYNWIFDGWSGRLDLNLTSNLRAFGRFTRNHFVEYRSDWTSFIVPGYNNLGPQGTGVTRDDQNGIVDLVYTLNPSTVLHGSAAVSNWMQLNTTLPYAFQFKPSDAGLPKYLDDNCGNQCYLPQMSVSGYSTNGVGGPSLPFYARFYDYNGDVYHNRGNHQFRAGFNFRQQTRVQHNGNSDGNYSFNYTYFRQYEDSGPNGDYNPATLGLSWASFMSGLPTGGSASNNASWTMSNQFWAAFLQDTWRVTPKLTLTLSLRTEWENGAKGHNNDFIVGWDPAAVLPISAPAQAAYAAKPIPELAASDFVVTGGALYAGMTGAPKRMWKSQLMWLPRIGVGYQIDAKTVIRGGYGLYYDTIDVNAVERGADQTGFSVNTGTTFTTNQGVTWGANGTNCGAWCNIGDTMTSPLTDPFPIRTSGTRFNVPVGNLYGNMGKLALSGAPSNWTVPYSDHARMQRWRASIERQISNNDVVTFGYTGAYTSKLNINVNRSALPSKYWYFGNSRPVNASGSTVTCANGTTNPTAAGCLEDNNFSQNVPNPFNIANLSALQATNPALYAQLSSAGGFFTGATIQKTNLLRRYPSSNLTVGMPLGHQRETQFDASLQHRFSHGLVASFSYGYFDGKVANGFTNSWDPLDSSMPQVPEWRPNNINPHRISTTWVYDIPLGKGRKWLHEKYAAALIGGWTVSGGYVWSRGGLIELPNAFYYGNLNDIKVSNPTLGNWFNTSGCVLSNPGPGDVVVPAGQPCSSGWDKRSGLQPGTYQARVLPRFLDGLRNPNYGHLDASLARDFAFNVRDQALTFSLRADMLNVMNHSFFGGVGTNVTNATSFGKITSGSAVLNRFIQIQGHIRW